MSRTPRLVLCALTCLAFLTTPLMAETPSVAPPPIEVAALASTPKVVVRAKSSFSGFAFSIEEWSLRHMEVRSQTVFWGFGHFPDFAVPATPTPQTSIDALFSYHHLGITLALWEPPSEQRFTLPVPYNPYYEFRRDWDQESTWLDLGDVVNRYTVNNPDIRFQVSFYEYGGRIGAVVPFKLIGKLLDK